MQRNLVFKYAQFNFLVMIRRLTYVILFLFCLQVSKAQSPIYICKNGLASFYSSAPLEDIEASNNHAVASLNISNKSLLIRVPINQFQFRNKLMQEHFNDIFMESKRYPEAVFDGKIFDLTDLSKPGVYHVTATGEFVVHGVERIRTLHGKITITQTNIILETQFEVLLADHDIEVPEIVFNKVAEKIRVNCLFKLSGPNLVRAALETN